MHRMTLPTSTTLLITTALLSACTAADSFSLRSRDYSLFRESTNHATNLLMEFYREEVIDKIVQLEKEPRTNASREMLLSLLQQPREVCLIQDPQNCIEECTRFLVENMPDEDRHKLRPDFLGENVAYALIARQKFPWSSDTPWSLFLNEILPYSSLAEPRDRWRKLFFREMQKHVRDISDPAKAALELNVKAWSIVDPPIKFAPAPPDELNNYSPFQVMKAHNASCTGLSIFLVDALRSIGLPARVAGVPHWNKGKSICPNGDRDAPCGNHDWVEVWISGSWHFLDQHGNDNALDVGWFYPGNTDLQIPRSKSHSIYASSFAATSKLDRKFYPQNVPVTFFYMVWSNKQTVPGWDVTDWYHNHEIRHGINGGSWIPQILKYLTSFYKGSVP